MRDDDKLWAVEFPNGTIAVSSDRALFKNYPTLESFQSDVAAMGFTTTFIDTPDHYINIKDNQHRGGSWVIEHGDACRVRGQMRSCAYTFFAETHINGSRVYPTGRFRMSVEDGYVTLTPVGE